MLLFSVALAVFLMQTIWLGRLWRLSLVGRYPALFVFLVTSTVLGVGMQVLSHMFNNNALARFYVYKWAWVATKPIYAVLLFCVLAEVYNRMVEDYHGLHRLGQLFMWAASGIAATMFLAMSVLGASPEEFAKFWNQQERSIYTALSIFSLLLISFSLYFRLVVSLNLRIIFAVFAVTVTSAALLRTVDDIGLMRDGVDGTQLGSIIYLAFLGLALMRFSAAGEHASQPLPIPRSLRLASEAEVTEGLVHLNQQLTRILRS
jgi:hypothetical protein